MRVFTATLGTETNTFAPMPTGLADFQGRGYDPSVTATADLPAFGQVCRALRERAAVTGWEVIEGKIAFASPSGMTTRHAYETLRDQLLADLTAALPVDMVLLQVHGAMIADGYEDAEGDLLARVRALIGPDVLLGTELDPHCHLTALKVSSVDLMVLFKEYPHTDIYDRARDLVRLAEDAVAGRIRPVMRVRDLGLVTLVHTSREPARGLVDRLAAMEGRDGILSLSIAHGFPWGDSPDLGTRVLAITDGDDAKTLLRNADKSKLSKRKNLKVALIDAKRPGNATRASAGGLWAIGESVGLLSSDIAQPRTTAVATDHSVDRDIRLAVANEREASGR